MLGFTKIEIIGAVIGAFAVVVLIDLIVDATMSSSGPPHVTAQSLAPKTPPPTPAAPAAPTAEAPPKPEPKAAPAEAEPKAAPAEADQSTEAEPAAAAPVQQAAGANPAAGKSVAKKCKTCHTFDEGGKNKIGPNLWAIVGAAKARDAAFKYSKALKAKGGTWTAVDLDAFLAKPKAFVPGTKMGFGGLKKSADRTNLIAYLATLGGTPEPVKLASEPTKPTPEPVVESAPESAAEPVAEAAEKTDEPAAEAEAPPAADDEPTPVAELWEECAGCHGEHGEGNLDMGAPRLNGQHEWYILAQLKNFRAGLRGTDDENDPNGNMMMGVAEGIEEVGALATISTFIAQMPEIAPQKAVKGGDPATGNAIYTANCTFCHGDAGQGNQDVGAPRLAGQSDWYVILQLNNFRASIRGTHKNDERGAQMQAMSTILPDEQSVLDVGAYISAMK